MRIDEDFDLCEDWYTIITERYGGQPKINSLPETYRTILLVWFTMGVIDNGGLEYLFESDIVGDPQYELTTRAFENIGCTIASSTLRSATGLFPGGIVPENSDERITHYRSQPEHVRDELNNRFWSVSTTGTDEIKLKLASYIRTHAGDLNYLKR